MTDAKIDLPVQHFRGRDGLELAYREMGAGRPLVGLGEPNEGEEVGEVDLLPRVRPRLARQSFGPGVNLIRKCL